MKKLLLFSAMLTITFALHSQTVIFEDNFDSYTAGTPLTVQNHTDWVTWNGGQSTGEDPMVTSEQSQTNPNSVKFSGYNDLLYKFQNQTTGVYKVEFDFYVPSSGSGGYFNNQHYANPGQQWAFEVYFHSTGGGYILAGSSTQIPFSSPSNQWFHIIFDVDLNNDAATLTIDGTVAHNWPYHYQASSQNGICQLGGMNFFAACPNGPSGGGTYYLDNFKVTEGLAPNPGQFVINPENPINITVINNVGTKVINISNPGGTNVDYEAVAVYNIPEPNHTSTGQVNITHAAAPGTNVQWDALTEFSIVSGYSPNMLINHIGKTIKKFNININNVFGVSAAKLCIWDMGVGGMPDNNPPIYEQSISVSSLVDGANTINLNEPWLIDGRYIYIGLSLTVQPGVIAINLDNTPVAQCSYLGRILKYGPSWQLLPVSYYDGAPLNGVWDMSISVDGTPIKPWITLNNASGTLQPDAEKDLTVAFGATDITENCTKEGKLYFFSTDFYKEKTILDVTANFIFGDVYTVSFLVNDCGTEDPIKDATIVFNGETITGYVIENVLSGKYPYTISSDSYTSKSGEITVVDRDITEIVCLESLGINEPKLVYNLYPNPASDNITIQRTSSALATIEIYNTMGMRIATYETSEAKYDVSLHHLSTGTYFIRVSEGKLSAVKGFVKN